MFSRDVLLAAALLFGVVIYLIAAARRQYRLKRLVTFARQVVAGQATGTLRPASRDALGQLEEILGRVGDAVAKRDAVLRAEAARQKLEAQIQRAINIAETEDDILDVAGRAIAEVFPERPAEILLADAGQTELQVAAMSAFGQRPKCPVDAPSGCPALRRAETMRFASSDAMDACPHLRARNDDPCSAVCIPLTVMGRSIGVMHAVAPITTPPLESDVMGLELIAKHVGARLGMVQALQTFQQQATTDPLTGVLNRRGFEDAASRVLRGRHPTAVVIADLDHFKRLNDAEGHEAGDRALRLFAQVIRSTVRPSDFAARLGGEEFAIMLPRCTSEGALRALERVQQALVAALATGSGMKFTASYGMAMYPDHGESLTDLLAAADRALYAAKERGRNRIVLAGVLEPVAASLAPDRLMRGSRAPATRQSVPPVS